MRIPGLAGKLEDSWDGPYEIFKYLNDVNYEICVPNKRKKLHVNNMKQWVAQQAAVLRIMALAEEVHDPHEKFKLSGNALSQREGRQL